MKNLLALIALAFVAVCACKNDDETTWDEYTDWRESNEAWLIEQQARTDADGNPYFSTIVPSWNPASYVLMHYCNDREETVGNLSPIFTSTVDVRYVLTNCDGDTLDSSLNSTVNGQTGIFRTRLDGVIQGWSAAIPQMRCGDSAEILIPYEMGYGGTNMGTIKPYSALRFNVRLVDIPYYETTPQSN